jgi:hypothetical protein
MTEINVWKCTDPDNFQFGKKVSENIFSFREFDRNIADGKFFRLKEMGFNDARVEIQRDFNCPDFWIEETIDLSKFSEKQIESYVSAYYSSVAEIEKIYKSDSKWIIAECIFEQINGLY